MRRKITTSFSPCNTRGGRFARAFPHFARTIYLTVIIIEKAEKFVVAGKRASSAKVPHGTAIIRFFKVLCTIPVIPQGRDLEGIKVFNIKQLYACGVNYFTRSRFSGFLLINPGVAWVPSLSGQIGENHVSNGPLFQLTLIIKYYLKHGTNFNFY